MRLYPSWTQALLLCCIFLTVASSAFVPFQPAPTDYLMLVTLALWLLLTWPKQPLPLAPMLALGVWLGSDLVHLLFRSDLPDPQAARTYVTLDLLMGGLAVTGVSICLSYRRSALYAVLLASLLAAVISVVPALTTLLGWWKVQQTLAYNLRLQGFFNYQGGTNDLGLLLVVATAFTLYMGGYSEVRHRRFFYALLPIFLLGLVLTFSRAAWVAMVVVLVVLLGLGFFRVQRLWLLGLGLVLGVGLASAVLLQQPRTLDYLRTRFSLQHYDNDRFAYNRKALEVGLSKPWGVGIGQAQSTLKYVVHSLYIRVLYENGWLGFLGLMSFIALSCVRLIGKARSRGAGRPVYTVLLAALVGLLVGGLVVDTVLLRFQWLVLALAWGEYEGPK